MALEFKPLNDIRCKLGESPVFDDRRNALIYCDILGKAIHCHFLATGKVSTWRFQSEVGSLGLAESGRILVAQRHVVGLFEPADELFRPIAEIEPERGPDTRLNDGKVGPDGAFWVGSMDDREGPTKEPIGVLYRVDISGKVEKKIEGLRISNGLAWSPDGRSMFHSDSRGPWIDRWDFDPATGAIANRTRIVDLSDRQETVGRPDGGATDAEGCYWSAGVSAGKLNRFSRDGTLLDSIAVPVGAPTMPCFGGPKLTTLFLTSLRAGRAPELLARFPWTGTTIVAEGSTAGSPVSRFRDM